MSTRIRSPTSTNSGTCNVAPVSSVAGFVPPLGDAVAAQARVGLRDLQVDPARQLDVGGLVVDEQHVHLAARLGPAQHLLQSALGDRDLLEGLRVHEVRVGPVGVQELHPPRLGPDGAELLPRPERPVDHVAV